MIGLDLAKNTFQAHGENADGSVAFRKKLRRNQVMAFFASQPRCTVAMEACASAHFWARSVQELGHEVRLVPPRYVKPFVKRQKNDAADAEAIAEAASRRTMRFVAIKSEAKQAQGMAFKTRDLLVRQRTQMINALRGNLAEFGVIAPKGKANLERLREVVDDADTTLPGPVVALAGEVDASAPRICRCAYTTDGAATSTGPPRTSSPRRRTPAWCRLREQECRSKASCAARRGSKGR
jgi:transposase